MTSQAWWRSYRCRKDSHRPAWMLHAFRGPLLQRWASSEGMRLSCRGCGRCMSFEPALHVPQRAAAGLAHAQLTCPYAGDVSALRVLLQTRLLVHYGCRQRSMLPLARLMCQEHWPLLEQLSMSGV